MPVTVCACLTGSCSSFNTIRMIGNVTGGQNVIMPEKTLEQAALEEYLDGGANEKSVIKQVLAASRGGVVLAENSFIPTSARQHN